MVIPKSSSLSDDEFVDHMLWEHSILFAIYATFLVMEVVILVRAKFSSDIRINKLSFVTYYLAEAQVGFTLVYLSPLLARPDLELNDDFRQVWGSLFLQVTCLLCEGIVLAIALNF